MKGILKTEHIWGKNCVSLKKFLQFKRNIKDCYTTISSFLNIKSIPSCVYGEGLGVFFLHFGVIFPRKKNLGNRLIWVCLYVVKRLLHSSAVSLWSGAGRNASSSWRHMCSPTFPSISPMSWIFWSLNVHWPLALSALMIEEMHSSANQVRAWRQGYDYELNCGKCRKGHLCQNVNGRIVDCHGKWSCRVVPDLTKWPDSKELVILYPMSRTRVQDLLGFISSR